MDAEFLAKARKLLSVHEGVRSRVYFDTEGVATIGVGRNVSEGGPGLRADEIEFMLQNDIRGADEALRRELGVLYVSLCPARRYVLVDMVHNLGVHGLLKFRRMLECLRAGDFSGASREMLASRWREQVGQRALRLAEMMVSGDYPPVLGGGEGR